MVNIKTKKGITIISLVLTIVIISILTTVAVYSQKSSRNIAPYNKMLADITLLEDKLFIYYNKNNEIPITGDEILIGEESYHKIDLTKLQNVTLNYGIGEDSNDYYLVNSSLEVYYLEGIENNGQIYHTKD